MKMLRVVVACVALALVPAQAWAKAATLPPDCRVAVCGDTFRLLAQPTPEPGAASAPESDILIFRPLEHNQRVVDPQDLLYVPGGKAFLLRRDGRAKVVGGVMYRFVVVVSAMTPIRDITVNGRSYKVPGTSSAEVSAPVVLNPGQNEIVVTATTDKETVHKSFSITLASLRVPGTPFYVAAPAR